MIGLLVLVARLRARLPRDLWRRCAVTVAAVVLSSTSTLVQVSQGVAASPPSPTSEAPLTPPSGIGPVWTAVWIPGPSDGTPGSLDIVANSAFNGTASATIDGHTTSLTFRSGTAMVSLATGVRHVVSPPSGTTLVAINAGPAPPSSPVTTQPQPSSPPASPSPAPTPGISASAAASAAASASASAGASETPSATAAPTATPTATAAPTPTSPPLPEPTLVPLDPGGPTSSTDGQRQSLAQWLQDVLDRTSQGTLAVTDSIAAEGACGKPPENPAALSQCIDKILGKPIGAVPPDLPPPDVVTENILKAVSDAAALEQQQQIRAKILEGIQSGVSADGPGFTIVEREPLVVPIGVAERPDSFQGTRAVLISQCYGPATCLTAANGRCGPTVIVVICAENSGESIAVGPDGTTTDVAGANNAPGVTVDEAPVVAPDGAAAVTNAEGLTSTTTDVSTIVDTSEAAAQSGILSKVATGLKWAERFGKVLGWAGLAIGAVNIFSDVGNRDYPDALHAGADTAWSALLLFGGSAAIADTVSTVAVASGLAAAVPLAPVVITVVVIILVSLAVGIILEAIFDNLFAPDIYIDNATGRDQDVGVRLATQGTHDVRPAWSGGAGVWNATAHPDGTLTVGGAAVGQLHYQLLGPAPFQRSAGWVVPRTDFAQWARAVLPRYGFDTRAVAGFVSSWAQLAEGGGSIDIYPQAGPLLDRLEPLTGTSSAGVPSVRRVWFVIAPADAGSQPAPPQVVDPPHAPIDVEEWGILLDRGADPAGGLQS